MAWTKKHTTWFVKAPITAKTIDGKKVAVWKFEPGDDPEIFSAWAKHFRNHYCDDALVDKLATGYKLTRRDYLKQIKFPSADVGLGPSIRAGDFGEILVCDFAEFLLNLWVPRVRWQCKAIANESTKGCDIIAFSVGTGAPEDSMVIFETKTQLSGNHPKAKLQEAVSGSAKDPLRKAESLNYIRQRLIETGRDSEADRVARFQNLEDAPFKELYGAAALFDDEVFSFDEVQATEVSIHSSHRDLSLLVITGPNLMQTVHALYERAADEA